MIISKKRVDPAGFIDNVKSMLYIIDLTNISDDYYERSKHITISKNEKYGTYSQKRNRFCSEI